MSIEAMNWAMTQVRIPETVDLRQRSSLRFVLLCLANDADSEGCNSFPTINAICGSTELSRSTVIRALRKLEELELIRKGSRLIVEAYADRADRVPNAYDLSMNEVSYGGPRGVIGTCTGCHRELDGVSYGEFDSPPAEDVSRASAKVNDRAKIINKKEVLEPQELGEEEEPKAKRNGVSAPDSDPDLDPQPEPEPLAKPKTKRKRYDYSDDFKLVWAVYRKGSKSDAFREWEAAITRAAPETIMAAIEPYLRSKPNKTYRKDLERWLSGDMWEAEVVDEKQQERLTDRRHQGSRERFQEYIAKGRAAQAAERAAQDGATS